jgi:3-hydroxyisobutyrate dehydrogenase-like beta-hydroxyacid dehydrogenase
MAPSGAAAVAGARIVVSAVTASSSRAVAEDLRQHLVPGQLFLDINSVSPDTKRGNAAAVEKSGASYVEAAVMGPVAPNGLKVPILLGGAAASELAAILNPAGMRLEVAATTIGQASAIKMCRSIMIKGLEALTVECLMTARQYGVEDVVIASLNRSFPQMDWEKLAGYFVERTIKHGRRRAAEMRESAATVSGIGIAPLMAAATAQRQDWVADLVAGLAAANPASEKEWRKALDVLAAHALGKAAE